MSLMILFEGINCAGKTTLIKAVSTRLEGECESISFPSKEFTPHTSTQCGKKLSYLLDFEVQMSKRLGEPQKDVYLVDRSFISTAVYQPGDESATLKIGAQALLKLDCRVMVVYVDCLPHVAAGRALGRAQEPAKDGLGGTHNAQGVSQEHLARKLAQDQDRFKSVIDLARTLDVTGRCGLGPMGVVHVDTTDGNIGQIAQDLAQSFNRVSKV